MSLIKYHKSYLITSCVFNYNSKSFFFNELRAKLITSMQVLIELKRNNPIDNRIYFLS